MLTDSPQAFLEALGRDSSGFLSYIDVERRVRFCNRGYAEWMGLAREAILGQRLQDLHGETGYRNFQAPMDRAFGGERVHYERLAHRPDGHVVWISVTLDPYRDESGEVAGVFSCALEVSELKRTHDALDRALQELASHMENTPLAVVEFSSTIHIRRWSRQAEEIFGWTPAEAIGSRPTDLGLIHEDSFATIKAQTRELRDGTAKRNRMLAKNVRKDGRVIYCEWYNSAFFDVHGSLISILGLCQDVTARVESEEQLRQAAVQDALTGLPNRSSLATRLEHAILRVNRAGDRLALLFIDLDRFKKVNDTLGHAAGDEVLRQAAARIRACVREVDTVARLGGDEFVVLLETDVRPDTPSIIGERIRSAFNTPFQWKSTDVRCGASVGISLYPDHTRDPELLLASADEAMYRAKQGA
ncbi:hypothetical protein DSM104443_00474 [Usitatibacter rugosus]|uniref:PAS domain S-box-containing protein/diguanylate cyclase (GGDEF)-like protein n=1 Tax=Usitatibacter rugosus TaxID=2732067 RepID=A0A6M4GQ28_9PROT|nr:diguanylate cyclase [Usitatibacter rugosus]QJR09430.1 hypothetical protein DSM104443_00474 [Usitatibacter rugosus]